MSRPEATSTSTVAGWWTDVPRKVNWGLTNTGPLRIQEGLEWRCLCGRHLGLLCLILSWCFAWVALCAVCCGWTNLNNYLGNCTGMTAPGTAVIVTMKISRCHWSIKMPLPPHGIHWKRSLLNVVRMWCSRLSILFLLFLPFLLGVRKCKLYSLRISHSITKVFKWQNC